ncbi:hypothetical protein JCM19992_06530 [Thermostilla marina]
MPIEFRCPGCNKLLRTPDTSAGKRAKCPSCGGVVTIPSASQSPRPAGGGQPSPGLQTKPSQAAPSPPQGMQPFVGTAAGGGQVAPQQPAPGSVPGSGVAAPSGATPGNPFGGPSQPAAPTAPQSATPQFPQPGMQPPLAQPVPGMPFPQPGAPPGTVGSAPGFPAMPLPSGPLPQAPAPKAPPPKAPKPKPTNLYAPPRTRSYQERARRRSYGGMGRLQYFLAGLGASFGIGFVGGLAGSMMENPAPAILGAQILAVLVQLVLASQRLQNIGWSPGFAFLLLVPVANFVIGMCLLILPEGYADTKRLDTAGKIVGGILLGVIGLFFLFIVFAMLAALGGG